MQSSTSALITSLQQLPKLGDPYGNERQAIEQLLQQVPPAPLRQAAQKRALSYISAVRGADAGWLSAQNLLASFPLASAEGVALLRLAEALLRAPDAETQTWLIAEKLAAFRNVDHDGRDGFIQRVLAGALKIAGHTASDAELNAGQEANAVKAWLARTALRPLVIDGIRRFGEQFVFANHLPAAVARAKKRHDPRELYSYDMLGEGARTAADAQRNMDAYANAIAALKNQGEPAAVSRDRTGNSQWQRRDGISVKLSAIHPRFETLQLDRVERELYPALLTLAQLAKDADINFTIDAEESERLVLQIALLEKLMREPKLRPWAGLGLALQAYQSRALAALNYLLALSEQQQTPLAIRLVKGAYWDAEIKRAQELGLPGFPVFTYKWGTDLSYLVLAQRLLSTSAPVYAQFATHNALTVASIVELAKNHPSKRYEFQRLHGMGAALYAALLAEEQDVAVRVYAPVGEFRDLLAYLVRRLLENGANSSFVHQISDVQVAPAALVQDPVELAQQALSNVLSLPALTTGPALFAGRANSRGIDLQYAQTLLPLLQAAPLRSDSAATNSGATAIRNPAQLDQLVGYVDEASVAQTRDAIGRAQQAFERWDQTAVTERAQCLLAAADRFEAQHDQLVQLLQVEAGKTLLDAHLEVREAIDFLRYYAQQAQALSAPVTLPGPVGESNQLQLSGRGVFACISPWNFPLAIFTGQIAAALVMGNTVVAKPAEQTPLIALRAVEVMHQAGIGADVLQLLCGRGETVGVALTSDPRIAGVAFTGSTDTARAINRALAARDAPIAVLIAETGGQNAMIVDSTALPEQVTDAVVSSSFRSAGQRCSALRVLLVQQEIADSLLRMIAGAMRELRIGDPRDPRTDLGPVIDQDQLQQLQTQRDWLRKHGRLIYECELPSGLNGHFFAPIAYEIDTLTQLKQEHFGPILHVIRFDKKNLDALVDQINATGYGLTCGLHSRLDTRVEQMSRRIRAGNFYVNRNIIGAVVGTQPFGGQGLSGTGPKAGGPHYLPRFASERTITINTSAAGGNIDLML